MTSRKRGAWPISQPLEREPAEAQTEAEFGVQYMQVQAEKARRHHVHASIRQHLAEQPNVKAVRSAVRRYKADLDRLGDSVIADKNRSETSQ